jgi:hypothetical protein
MLRLTKLGLNGVLREAKLLEDAKFEPFSIGNHRDLEVNIPLNVDNSNPLALLDLFVLLKTYTVIAENTNLYAIARNALTTRSPTSS